MIRSYFTATSGALTESRNLSVRSNNIANANTTGFKKDTPINSTFAQMLLTRVGEDDRAAIGEGAFMNVVQTPATDYSQGSYEDTDRPFDFAIAGEGYFSVMGDNNQIYLTRDGSFYRDEEGFLRHTGGGLVLDDADQSIQLMGGDRFSVNAQGDILEDGSVVARIGVTNVAQPQNMIKVNEGFWRRPEDGTLSEDPAIRWKSLERSNVNVTQEMTDVIANSRHFQACSQIMKMIDEMTQKTVNEIARMG